MRDRFKKGDHLVTNIDVFGVTEHHGVYVGDGKVIHLTGKDATIVKTDLYGFSDGKEIRVKQHSKNPSMTLSRAYGKLGKKGYNLLTNNCEHFSNWCLTKTKKSEQVEKAASTIIETVLFGMSPLKANIVRKIVASTQKA